MKQWLVSLGVVCLGMVWALGTPLVCAQGYPNKPVRILVPFPAGGNTDQIARITGDWLSRAFNQQFVVENRAGAFGTIAAEAVIKSPADGYTLFMTSHAQVVSVPLMIAKRTYDPQRDFAPVSIVGTNGFVLGVLSSLPVNNVREFVAYAKGNPGKLNFSSGGPGSMSHLSGALFVQRADVEIAHIPFKGGAPAAQALLGGQVQMYFGNYSELIPHAEGGRVRLLGVSGEKRAPQLPNIPTIAEGGYPGFKTITFNGLVAPAGTPADVIDRVSQEVQKMVKDTAAGQKLTAIGVELWGSTPKEMADTIASELALWEGVVKRANLKLE